MTEKLSERVERLEGPDREIEVEIAVAIGAPPDTHERGMCHGKPENVWYNKERWKDPYWQPPYYTSSLDAAMSLVPEGWRISNFSQHDHAMLRERGEWKCSFYPDGRLGEGNRNFDWPRCEHAATPAIALCAAALKARGL